MDKTLKYKLQLDTSQAKQQLKGMSAGNGINVGNVGSFHIPGIGSLSKFTSIVGVLGLALDGLSKIIDSVTKEMKNAGEGYKNAQKQMKSFIAGYSQELVLRQSKQGRTFEEAAGYQMQANQYRKQYDAIAQQIQQRYSQMFSALTEDELDYITEHAEEYGKFFTTFGWDSAGPRKMNTIMAKLRAKGFGDDQIKKTLDTVNKDISQAGHFKQLAGTYETAAQNVANNIKDMFVSSNLTVGTAEISKLASIGGYGSQAAFKDTIPDKLDKVSKLLDDIKNNTSELSTGTVATYGE